MNIGLQKRKEHNMKTLALFSDLVKVIICDATGYPCKPILVPKGFDLVVVGFGPFLRYL